jgi:hypothetical protein
MRPVETSPEMRGGRIKNIGGSEFNYDKDFGKYHNVPPVQQYDNKNIYENTCKSST